AFMSTGVGKQRQTVQLAKTQLVRDPKSGKQVVGDLAFKGGKPVYLARPSVASRDTSLGARVGRALNIGRYSKAAETQAEIEQARISREVFSTRREDQSHLKEASEKWARLDDRLDRMQEKEAQSMTEEATARAAIGNAVQDLESWHEQQDKKWVQADAAKKQEQEQQSHREASDIKARQDVQKEMTRKWLELDEWEKQQDAMWAEEQE
ncbi:MAG: hypothetical protein ACK56I_29255, partial [bacterium]